MLLWLFAAATAAMVFIEYQFVKSFPRVGAWIVHHPGRAFIFSLALSWVLEQVFPAAGLITMMASIASTVVMRPVYAFWRTKDRIKTAWAVKYNAVRHPIASRRAA